MSSSPYAYQRYLLHSLSLEFRLPDVTTLARQPGTQAVYRITCHYPDALPPNTVATLVQSQAGRSTLSLAYEGMTDAPTPREISKEQFAAFNAAILRLKFDKLDDQPAIAPRDVSIWLVERAAAGFHKDVLLSPEGATDAHANLIETLRSGLPEAVRVIGTNRT